VAVRAEAARFVIALRIGFAHRVIELGMLVA
jgi:hypothetical protein